MTSLIRDTDLAEEWEIPVKRLHRLRREKGLPCVKFSRLDIRFTPEQADEIVKLLTVTPGRKVEADAGNGLTSRSAARGRA